MEKTTASSQQGASTSSTSKVVLDVRDISVSFGGVKPVRGVTFTLVENTFTSIIGPNGAGKTSLFNLVSGINKVDSGEILLEANRSIRFKRIRSHKKVLSEHSKGQKLFVALLLQKI